MFRGPAALRALLKDKYQTLGFGKLIRIDRVVKAMPWHLAEPAAATYHFGRKSGSLTAVSPLSNETGTKSCEQHHRIVVALSRSDHPTRVRNFAVAHCVLLACAFSYFSWCLRFALALPPLNRAVR